MAAKKKVAKKKAAKKKTAKKKYQRPPGARKKSVLEERRRKKEMGGTKIVAPAPVEDATLDYEVEVLQADGDTRTVRLTHKQLMFCYEWLKDFNAGRAAVRAGYGDGSYNKSAANIGSANMQNPAIQAKINQLQADTAKTLAMNTDEIVQHWSGIGRFDVRNLYTPEGDRLLEPYELDDYTAKCVSGIKVSRIHDKEDETTEYSVLEYKIVDKHQALGNRARHLGMYKDALELDMDAELKQILKESSGKTVGPPKHRDEE